MPFGDHEETVLGNVVELFENMEWGDGACHIFVVVIRDVTADWYARSGVKEWRYGAGNIAAHVLEIDVDAVWTGAGKFFRKVTRFVINAVADETVG